MPTEKDWFCHQVRSCQNGLYHLAISILKNESDAQDAVQEALFKAYDHLGELKQKDKFKPWLMRILSNVAYGMLRGRKITMDLNAWEELPQNNTLDIHTKITLWDTVQALPAGYRIVIVLYYYENLTIKEIGGITGLTPATVKKRLSRAREQLKAVLKEV